MGDTSRRDSTLERVTVIGLGRFGTSLVRHLYEIGYDVIAIDINQEHVDVIQRHRDALMAVRADGTDEQTLRDLEVDRSEVAVVAQGENLEASVLTTLLLKRIGVPFVVSKAKTDLHGELLSKVGADQVIFPEKDAGRRLAHSLGARVVSDYITLSANAGIAKLTAPEGFVGSTIGDLVGYRSQTINVLVIRRGNNLINLPSFQEVIRAGDEIVVVGGDRAINAFVSADPVNARDKRT
ncbi:MAG TPA: TrkA family potassium uptake protein [Thermomicrobiales bacterium]|nr:TrkA family potassium uptake protein [Thermomicrobiales bacterium]